VNLIDAVKSGKPFKRKIDKGVYWQLAEPSLKQIAVSREDILATDWEIEERKIEITESELDYIFNSLLPKPSLVESMFEIKKRLFDK
jgi:hypothetical protein